MGNACTPNPPPVPTFFLCPLPMFISSRPLPTGLLPGPRELGREGGGRSAGLGTAHPACRETGCVVAGAVREGPRCPRTPPSPTAARRAAERRAGSGLGQEARGPPGPPGRAGWRPRCPPGSSSPLRWPSWPTSWSSSRCSGIASSGTQVSATPAAASGPSLVSGLAPDPDPVRRQGPAPRSLLSHQSPSLFLNSKVRVSCCLSPTCSSSKWTGKHLAHQHQRESGEVFLAHFLADRGAVEIQAAGSHSSPRRSSVGGSPWCPSLATEISPSSTPPSPAKHCGSRSRCLGNIC